jgi:siderophore synthetase component
VTAALTTGGTAASEAAAAALATGAPDLVAAFRAALPRAAQTVGRRLLGALVREDVGDSRHRYADRGTAHGFDRVEFAAVPADHPVRLLPDALAAGDGQALAAELDDAVVNLAIAYARQPVPADRTDDDPDGAALRAERLAVDGHNLHPCGRTRLGWRTADVLRHDLEAGGTRVGFVAVRAGLHSGDDVGAALAPAYPVPAAPPGYVLQPVHEWQLGLLRRRHAALLRDGAVRPVPGWLPAAPTAALRTLLLAPGADGHRRYLKLSLDIQVTSTRRTISEAATRNGPAISALLGRLLADDPAGRRVLLLPEVAGAALPAGGRDAGAIVRGGLAGRLDPAEEALPGGALAAGRVLAGLVGRYAATRGRADGPAAALAFLAEYARLLLTPVLRLAVRFGIGLEAHLQNCLPTFVAGVPHRMVFRDFAGLRLHEPRLAAAGAPGWPGLWPGSVIGTADPAVMRAKVGYTALQAHLGELVVRLAGSHGLAEDAAWRLVRAVLDEVFEPLRADPSAGADAAADHAALTAPTVPHKALVRMRLGGARGDVYVPVRNPLHAP